jgi:heptosyltransferase-2
MKILIVGPAWVGDMVMAQTLFIAIQQEQPDAIIDVLAPGWSNPLLERMPEVRKALNLPIGHGELKLCLRRRIGKSMRAEGYDQAILLPNSLKSALVPFFAGIPKRTGWKGESRYILLNDLRVLDKDRYPLMIERFIALAYPEGAPLPAELPRPALKVDPANVDQAMSKYGLNHDRKVLALCPGAEFGPSKRWPENYFADIAQVRIDEGWQVWLFGSAKDREVTDMIARSIGQGAEHIHNLAGDTSLADAVDLLSVADAVVSNDSGLMHIAAAHNRPLVVPYGSTSPDFTPPLNDHKQIVRTDLDCSPCFQRVCPLGHTNCMKQLTPGRILEALKALEARP